MEQEGVNVPAPEQGFRALPFTFAKQFGVLLAAEGDGTIAYHAQTLAPHVISELRRYIGCTFSLKPIDDAEFQRRLSQAYQRDNSEAVQMAEDIGADVDLSRLADEIPDTGDLMDAEDDAPIIRLINAILSQAVREKASDIHVETFEDRLSIRYRIDGVLAEVLSPKRMLAPLLVSRLKVMAKLDIAEKRTPQDGRIALKIAGREVDIRVSTIPSNHGERIVLRILDRQAGKLNFTQLGMNASMLAEMKALIKKPHGIILVTGPTGSGKTTTLYAALQSLNHQTRNIMTVEDPIEYSLPGIGQTQVNSKVSMTFAKGLRAILRQDPDVVMIGEIRDIETAQIAVEASLTGHLVMSTLHTNSAVGAVTRLQDMGVEPFLLSSSIVGVLSQRLIRVLCPECRIPYHPDAAEKTLLKLAPDATTEVFKANGCSHCRHTGYKGRIGIYELLTVDEKMQQLIHSQNSEEELTRQARLKHVDILSDGVDKVLQGITTLEEVLRVCNRN